MGNVVGSNKQVDDEEGTVSSSSRSAPSLHDNLMRTQKNRDPMKYYEVMDVLGVGSMGSVAKVKKRSSAVGGSARKTFRQQEQTWCFGGRLLQCCRGGSEDTKEPLLTTTDASNSSHQGPILRKQSSLITYGHKDDYYFALKSIILERAANETFIKELQNEVAILKTLDHPNIVRPMETFSHKNQLYILMEICDGGDLYARDPYSEREAARIISSILSAIAYMHGRNVTHRDLKYENVMFVNKHPHAEVKLIDFGLSVKYGMDETLHDAVGTVYSMSPEVLHGEYTSKTDVWSVGVLAFMLLSSSMPFYGSSRKSVIRRILKGQYSFKARMWKYVSDEAKEFVKRCLTYDADERPTADEALHLAWLVKDYDHPAPELDSMDMVQASMQNFASYGTLKKLALMVIAHKSTSEEIGFLRTLFSKYDSLKNGVITLPEFKEALVDYDYSEEELETMFGGLDVDGTGEVKYGEFLAATIEAHGGISEQRLAEAFDRIDCDDSGYITVHNLTDMLGPEMSKSYLARIIDEADIKRDKRVSYEEFLALWDEGEDVKREQTLEDVKRRRLFHQATSSAISAVSAVFSSSFISEGDENMSELSTNDSEHTHIAMSGGQLFQMEKGKSVRKWADI